MSTGGLQGWSPHGVMHFILGRGKCRDVNDGMKRRREDGRRYFRENIEIRVCAGTFLEEHMFLIMLTQSSETWSKALLPSFSMKGLLWSRTDPALWTRELNNKGKWDAARLEPTDFTGW